MKRRRLNGNVVSGIGILLLFCALALLSYNLWDSNRAKDAASNAVAQIEEYRDEQDTLDTVTDGTSESDLTSEVEIDGISYIGTIRVPALGLELPVITELTDDLLKTGPCRYTGSAKDHNLVIAAHNYRRHFGQLHQLKVGDVIQFVTMNGEEYSYQVAENEVLAPTQISEMIESEYDLTLFTCTNGGQARYALRCMRTQS